MAIVLRPHQSAAADAVEQAWREGVARPLVDACVAAGKSYMFAELARREVQRGGRVIVCAHTRELVEQNAKACRDLMPHVDIGINAAALDQKCWRAPIISASIQSVYKYAHNFGLITLLLGDEAHLWPHSENGMYRQLARDLNGCRVAGASGTVFRLQGGSLIEGEGAPFDKVVFQYSILDGIRDGYLCPAFSIGADDKVDPAKLRVRQGEFTAESSDAQMLELMDSHILQIKHHGADRRAWLIFEAGTKAATAMAKRLGEWGIAAGLVLGTTEAGERARLIERFRAGRLRALVNVAALTTGFDVPHVDLLVMRRPTKSLGLYIQMVGRALRTVGGNIEASIAAGKADAAVLDFAGNIDRHGPLDFIKPADRKLRLVTCESCGKRNPSAARKCWACDADMMKNCTACLEPVVKGTLDCPHCGFDMRTGGGKPKDPKLSDVPSGAALLAAFKAGSEREGGWLPISKVWRDEKLGRVFAKFGGAGSLAIQMLPEPLEKHAASARWARLGAEDVDALLVPNGLSRTSARQIAASGAEMIVPLPAERKQALTVND